MQQAKTFWRDASPALRGILLMLASTLCFSVMHAMVRYISSEVPPIEIAFFRSAFGLVVFLPWLLRHGLEPLRTKRFPLHGLRAGLNCLAMFAFYTGLSMTPLADATAIGFTVPIFAAVFSLFVLQERFRLRRWTAIGLGFVGTLIILRPGFQEIGTGPLLVIGSAVLWAATLMVIKILGRTETSLTITTYMNLLLTALALIPTLVVWRTPSLEAWLWLFVIGVVGTVAQLIITQSLKEAEAGLVMPFDFCKLLWAALLGFWIFGEVPDAFVWLGSAIVVGATSYLAYRESQISKSGAVDK